MFGRLLVVIAGVGLMAVALLSLRHLRIQAAHELVQSRLRTLQLEEQRLALRARIAELVTPTNVARMAEAAWPLKPLAAELIPRAERPDDRIDVLSNAPGGSSPSWDPRQ